MKEMRYLVMTYIMRPSVRNSSQEAVANLFWKVQYSLILIEPAFPTVLKTEVLRNGQT